jgi:hypothetical protein
VSLLLLPIYVDGVYVELILLLALNIAQHDLLLDTRDKRTEAPLDILERQFLLLYTRHGVGLDVQGPVTYTPSQRLTPHPPCLAP